MTSSDSDALFKALLGSATRLSFDPRDPLVYEPGSNDSRLHGMTPEWSPLFGTRTWAGMSEDERIRLTRCEVAQFLGVGIWLEMGLQVALLRKNHSSDPARPDVKFLFNECADENLHSLMLVNAVDSIGSRFYPRDRILSVLGFLFRSFAWEEAAYGIVLAGEEIFDVMQRDWMASENVAEPIRRTSYIHVVEESRHMVFARRKIRDRLAGTSSLRRYFSSLVIAIGTHVIAKSLINRRVYEDLGLDWNAVKLDIDANEHHRMMFRKAAEPFIEFMNKEGLLNSSARWVYRKSNLL
ncbi:diiron oxygenase [Nocardia sp. NBC_00565]|uniref:AurF N-oxygenase family protein n=1 Tax=Nocardia sp. NBC_00565 TaxID=2975993 RepID=UPI002E8013CD|nr:diiron oxygenase [Nocardia sp. NBC_00565]WUC00675.1 diiron oxygenase [Nocardia sp. NBC_00565]